MHKVNNNKKKVAEDLWFAPRSSDAKVHGVNTTRSLCYSTVICYVHIHRDRHMHICAYTQAYTEGWLFFGTKYSFISFYGDQVHKRGY